MQMRKRNEMIANLILASRLMQHPTEEPAASRRVEFGS